MAIIAPGICRYTVNGNYLGRPTANILDMLILESVGGISRDDEIVLVGQNILSAWTTHILGFQSNAFTAESVSFVDLSAADGVVGVVTAGDEDVWPQQGALTGPAYAGSVALLIQKQAVARRGQRQGRMFLPGLTETYVSGNTLDASLVDPLNEALILFVEQLTIDALPEQGGYYPVVVHTTNQGTPSAPDIVYNGASQIQVMAGVVQVASQRRRNRP